MANDYFRFKKFVIIQDKCSFKVGTDGVLLGASADVSNATRILDVGAGTGLISIMLAQRCNADIVAIEPDEESFNQLLQNLNSCQWNSRIKAYNESLQNFNSSCRFNLIVSNPPYFQNSIRNPDARKSSARHNDSLPNSDLIDGVMLLLEENGLFQVVIPSAEGARLIIEAEEKRLYCNSIIKIRPTPSSAVRRLVLTFGKTKKKLQEEFLTIENGKRHSFTEEYINLTKDFYLKF
ncbi:MAG TPA: FkbM family methyltransferase [Bacteroidales bacterium]|nr:FkbM family methyltransferase [Bacteroidales bacterium]